MKRALLALLFVASTAWAQTVETKRVDVETRRVDGSSSASVPSTCTTAGQVPMFLGSRLELGCDAGLTYDSTTDTLTVRRVATPALVGQGVGLSRADAWSVFNAGAIGGLDTTRRWGAPIFTGKLVIFPPGGGSALSGGLGTFSAYDPSKAFSDPSAWSAYDASATGGLNTTGYSGCTWTGRYMVCAPERDSTDTAHGRVLWWDSLLGFGNPSAWGAYDASATGGLDCRGYRAAWYDGVRYVYFAPFRVSSALADYHGRVLRLDTLGSLTASGSWSVYDIATEHGSGAKGYKAITGVGPYVFFAPSNNNGSGQYAIVARYDSRLAFDSAAAWDAIDVQTADGLTSRGFSDTKYDGRRYLYLIPIGDSTSMHGKVVRYDTWSSFLSLTSWSAYDAGGASSQGFVGAFWVGTKLVLVPYYQGVEGGGGDYHGTVVTYESTRGFKDPSAWERYDASATGGLSCKGYTGGVAVDDAAYFSPFADGSGAHGRVLRWQFGAASTRSAEVGSRWIGTRQEIPFRKVLTDNVATEVFEVALAAGDMIGSGGMYSGTVTITATEGTNVQIGLDRVTWTATRTPAGAQTCAVVNLTTAGSALNGAANSTGTLGSYGWSCDVATAGKVVLSYRADSSLTAPTVLMVGVITVDAPNAVTLK